MSFYLSKSIKLSSTIKWEYPYVPNKSSTQNYEQEISYLELHYSSDIELLPRVEKAFKHLAYLAKEKRKKERKETGEKF